MQVAMLGPLEVRTDDDSGIVLDVGGSRLRRVLPEAVTGHADLTPTVLGVLGLREQALLYGGKPLNITGEALWTVGPLTLPPDPAVSSDSPERAGVRAPRPPQAPPGTDGAVDLPRGPAGEPDSESPAVPFSHPALER